MKSRDVEWLSKSLKVGGSAIWLCFCLWMLAFSMPLSAGFGGTFLAICWMGFQARKWVLVGALVAAPFVVWRATRHAPPSIRRSIRLCTPSTKSRGGEIL